MHDDIQESGADVDSFVVGSVAIMTAIIVASIVLGVKALFNELDTEDVSAKYEGTAQLDTYRSEQAEKLAEYRWVDKEKNQVGLPIDVAVKLTAEQGIRPWHDEAPAKPAKPAPAPAPTEEGDKDEDEKDDDEKDDDAKDGEEKDGEEMKEGEGDKEPEAPAPPPEKAPKDAPKTPAPKDAPKAPAPKAPAPKAPAPKAPAPKAPAPKAPAPAPAPQ